MHRTQRASRVPRAAVALLAAALLVGCSSAPRQFAPRLAVPPVDAAAFQRAHESCRQKVAEGQRDNFGADRGTSAGVGLAVGAGVALASSAGAGSSMIAGYASAVAAGAALFVLAPVVIFATSRYIRSGKEDEINKALGHCLAANGHAVSEWELAPAR